MKVVLSVVLAFFVLGCSEQKEELEKVVETKVEVHKVEKKVEKVVQKVVEPVTEKVVEPVAKKVAAPMPKEVVAPVAKKVIAPIAKVEKPAVDGKLIFSKCIGCHGKSAELAALRKSKIIKGWSADKVVHALNGYKDGTYGSTMKGVMKSQVKSLSQDDINAVAKYISGL